MKPLYGIDQQGFIKLLHAAPDIWSSKSNHGGLRRDVAILFNVLRGSGVPNNLIDEIFTDIIGITLRNHSSRSCKIRSEFE